MRTLMDTVTGFVLWRVSKRMADKIDFTTINRTYKPIASTVTSTSSNYTQTAFSTPVRITVPTEVGATYLVTMNGTYGTDKDSRQTIFAIWNGPVSTGTRLNGASGMQTLANLWYSNEFIRAYFTANSTSTTLNLSCGCGGTSVKCSLVSNVIVNVQRTTYIQ